MSTRYKAREPNAAYFVTLTITAWIHIFTRLRQKHLRFIKQKMNYIHNNPVVYRIVEYPEDYLFSSARNYAGLHHEPEVVVVFMG